VIDAAVASTVIENRAIDPAIAARLDPGRLFAFAVDDAIVVARLDRHGVTELRRGPIAGETAWTRDGVLVTMLGGSIEDRSIKLWTYPDPASPAVAPVELAISGADSATGDVPVPGARLVETTDGEVWLQRCLDHEQRVVLPSGIVDCEAWRYRRIAPNPGDETATKPPGYPPAAPPPPPRVDPPAGYTVKPAKFTIEAPDGALHHVGWDCTGPTGTSRFPDAEWSGFDHYTGKAVRWLQTDPPIYMITGTSVSLIGERDRSSAVFLACRAEPLYEYVDLGGGAWAELTQTGWIVRVGATDLATIHGGGLDPAPAPR
jgi:hypothetical protein